MLQIFDTRRGWHRLSESRNPSVLYSPALNCFPCASQTSIGVNK